VREGERLDPADLALRRWASEDRILRHARHLSAVLVLDPEALARLESACLHNDHDALMRVVATLMAEIEALQA
jgi:hypothetical protein